jgi:hypothetical protein
VRGRSISLHELSCLRGSTDRYDVTVPGLLAYGMLVPRSARHADATPLVAIVVAILLARFVVGLPLTPMTGVLAAFGGSLWAALAQGWGIGPPSVVGLVLVLGLRSAVRRVGSHGAG